MPISQILLIWIYILISPIYGLQSCGGITYDRRNYTLTITKNKNPLKTVDCLTDLKYDYIHEGEGDVWTIQKNDPLLYFNVTVNNKTKRFCISLMKDESPKCDRYRTDRENVIIFFDNKDPLQPKKTDKNLVNFSKYLRTNCDNQDILEDFFAKCVIKENLEKTTQSPKIDINESTEKADNVTTTNGKQNLLENKIIYLCLLIICIIII